MKNRFIFLFILGYFLLCESLTYPQTLKVDSPKQGEIWRKFKSHTITWKIISVGTRAPKIDEYVKIRLYKPDKTTLIRYIVNPTDNDGSYTISSKLFDNVPLGNYRIKVMTTDNQIEGFSEIFTIGPGLKPGSIKMKDMIKITIPNKNTKWKEGDSVTIRWQSIFKEGFTIKLLYEDSKKVRLINTIGKIKTEIKTFGKKQPNKFYFNWQIPTDIYRWPGNYRIQVSKQGTNEKLFAVSDMFQIKPKVSKIKKNLTPAKVNNCRRRKTVEYSFGMLFTKGKGDSFPIIGGKLRVGFTNSYQTKGVEWSYTGYVYQAMTYFNLDEFQGKPGVLVKATLVLTKFKTSKDSLPEALNNCNSCASKLADLTAPFTKKNCLGNKATFYAGLPYGMGALDPKVVERANQLLIDVTHVVRNWINYPKSNYGFLLKPFNQNFDHDNAHCVSFYDSYLSIHWEGKY